MSQTIDGCADSVARQPATSDASGLLVRIAFVVDALAEGIVAARRFNALIDGGTPAAEAARASLLSKTR